MRQNAPVMGEADSSLGQEPFYEFQNSSMEEALVTYTHWS